MKTFNKPEKAKELNLGIIEIPDKDAVITIDIKNIPPGYSVDDFIQLIKDEGIAIVDT